LGLQPVFRPLDDFVERRSALSGNPQQIVEKVHRYHSAPWGWGSPKPEETQ
jgi:hypothetical protein